MRRKLISVNSNGLSCEKIDKLARLVIDCNATCLFIQEAKRSTYPNELQACFPPEKFSKRFTRFEAKNSNQGLISLVRIDPNVAVTIVDESENGLLRHTITFNNGKSSTKIANIYYPPSASVSEDHFQKFVDFECVAGDINLNAGNRAQLCSDFCENESRLQWITWPTFQPHNSNSRCSNLTDCIISKPNFVLQVRDLGITIGDHATLVVDFEAGVFETSTGVETERNKSHFNIDLTLITPNFSKKAWEAVPVEPNWSDLMSLKKRMLEHCITRNKGKPSTTEINLEYTPAILDANESTEFETTPLSTFWETTCSEINELKNVGQVFRVIKTFKDSTSASKVRETNYSRRDLNKSFQKFRNKVAESEKLSKENYNKYKRILGKSAKALKTSSFRPKFTPKEVEKEIAKSNAKAASGPDNFNMLMLPVKDDLGGLEKLTNFINSLFQGDKFRISSSMKLGKLCFIPKNESTGDVRPLVLSSRILSIVDRLVNNYFLNFINKSPSLRNRFAYRPLLGCEDCLGSCCEFISEARRIGEMVGVAQVDLSSAFNGVGHKNIILKVWDLLVEIGFTRNVEALWTIMFLKNWLIRNITFENATFTLKRGVPQGSPLSPSLFNISFAWNWRTGSLEIRICFYADDVSILIKGKIISDVRSRLIEAVRDFTAWCDLNEFKVNYDKSKIMMIGPTAMKKNIQLPEDLAAIKQVKNLRILGVEFDENFSFVQHVLDLEEYFKPRIIAIRQLRLLGLSEWNLRVTVLALRSKLAFGLYQNIFMSKSLFNRLDLIFTKLVRAWTKASNFVNNSILFEQAGVASFRSFSEYLLASRYISKNKSFSFFSKKNWCPQIDPTLITLPDSPPITTRILRSSTIADSKRSLEEAQARKQAIEEKKRGPIEFIANMGEVTLEKIENIANACLPPADTKKALKFGLGVESVKKSKEDVRKRIDLFEEIKKKRLGELDIPFDENFGQDRGKL